MAFTCIRASSSFFHCHASFSVCFILGWASRTCSGFGSTGSISHHRFSDPVKAILGSDELPEKGSAEYFAAMAHRDRLIRGRHLSSADGTTPLTFVLWQRDLSDWCFWTIVEFEIYSPNTSSTSKKVSCNSTYCEQPQHCASAASDCHYKIEYLSNDTSSTGVLVIMLRTPSLFLSLNPNLRPHPLALPSIQKPRQGVPTLLIYHHQIIHPS
ncbi:hypothetical protein GBA52_023210 [Prunus armeniaca]|nr:hypothetical protein GBA52_023210 [Prunus armeniaca]